MPNLSFVIPAYNEQDSLVQLHQEIATVAADNSYDFEIVFVDDGSTDDTWKIIESLSLENENVKAIMLRGNYGKAAALRAGTQMSSGDLVITMDADLQDDPAEVPKMLAALTEDFDMVSGWKEVRNDPVNKTMPSKVFNWLVGLLTGVRLHDHNCGFKLYRREIFDEVKLYGEMHRFVPVLAAAKGFRVTEIPVNHRARQHGVSKYGLAFGMFAMAIYWILRMVAYPEWTPLHQRPVVLYSVGLLILGTQLLSMGFLAELIVAKGQSREEPYSIAKKLE